MQLLESPPDPPRAAANPAYYFGASGVSALAFFPLWKDLSGTSGDLWGGFQVVVFWDIKS